MKTCIRCDEQKEEEGFGWHQREHNRRRTVCRKCRNADTIRYRKHKREHINTQIRERIRRRKLEWVEKKGGVCKHCGGKFHPSVFDFHHPGGRTNKYPPGQMFTRSEETIKKELDGCVLLCANCHRMEHNDY